MKSYAFIFLSGFFLPLTGYCQLIDVPYHQQEKSWYCGAATAQMVLHYIGYPYSNGGCVATSTDNLNCDQAYGLCQTCLYKSNRVTVSQDRAWLSYPDALLNTINTYIERADTIRFMYMLYTPTDKSVLCQKIVNTLSKYRMPVVASIYPNDHWVVVVGTHAEASGSIMTDINSINGYWIHNPFPQLPREVSSIHSDSDSCGKPELEENRGLANEHITKDVWFDQYLQPVADGEWAGKFLALTDTEDVSIEPVNITRRKPKNNTDVIISEKKAARWALDAVKSEGFTNNKNVSKEIIGASAGKPMLVQYADRERAYYYIVPLLNKEKNAVALISIDAITGNYRQAIFASPGTHLNNFTPKQTPSEIIKIVQEKFGIVSGDIDSLSNSHLINPIMIWRPNLTSMSPFYPFYQVKYGANTFYLRLNSEEAVSNLYTESKKIMTN